MIKQITSIIVAKALFVSFLISFLVLTLTIFGNRFTNFFNEWPEQMIAFSIATYISIVYINEVLPIIGIKIFTLSRIYFNFSIVLLIASFMWSIQKYVSILSMEDLGRSDDIFLIVLSTIVMKFYMLARITFKNSDFRILAHNLSSDY